MEEAINLARATNFNEEEMVNYLVKSGRSADAVAQGMRSTDPRFAHRLAERMRQQHPLGAFKLVLRALVLINGEREVSASLAGQQVLWLCKHAHECDAFMRGAPAAGVLVDSIELAEEPVAPLHYLNYWHNIEPLVGEVMPTGPVNVIQPASKLVTIGVTVSF